MTKARYVLPRHFDLVGRKLRFLTTKLRSAAGTGVQGLHQREDAKPEPPVPWEQPPAA